MSTVHTHVVSLQMQVCNELIAVCIRNRCMRVPNRMSITLVWQRVQEPARMQALCPRDPVTNALLSRRVATSLGEQAHLPASEVETELR